MRQFFLTRDRKQEWISYPQTCIFEVKGRNKIWIVPYNNELRWFWYTFHHYIFSKQTSNHFPIILHPLYTKNTLFICTLRRIKRLPWYSQAYVGSILYYNIKIVHLCWYQLYKIKVRQVNMSTCKFVDLSRITHALNGSTTRAKIEIDRIKLELLFLAKKLELNCIWNNWFT